MLLSSDEELADLSLSLFHLRNSCFEKFAKKFFPIDNTGLWIF